MIEELKKRNETNWKEKSLNGKFPKSIVDFADSVSWQWLRSGYVKKNAEAIITAAQDQTLRTNWIKVNIDGIDCSPLCGVCHSVDESAMRIASGCEQLAKRRYMIRHNLIATRVHWELCRKYEIKVTRNLYEHAPSPYTVTQTGIEILWDAEIKTTTQIKHNRPDIVVKMPEARKWKLIDIAIPQDHNIVIKENEKVNKYDRT